MTVSMSEVFGRLSMAVLERGWLSSNNIVFVPPAGAPTAVVDTGYDTHADQTVALLRSALGQRPLDILLNTHLHSDHAGGNALIQSTWPLVETWVPARSFEAVSTWSESALSYVSTNQVCRRFTAQCALVPGTQVDLGGRRWNVVAAGGHDDDAVMLFEPCERVLLAGDALWRRRLAIVFSALGAGNMGFAATESTLRDIEQLDPLVVVPGHGAPFVEVAEALQASREILARFQSDPDAHTLHAARALIMFQLLSRGRMTRREFDEWLACTPIFRSMAASLASMEFPALAQLLLSSLRAKGAISFDEGWITATTGR